MMTLDERFWSRVDASGDCWIWTRYIDWQGYGFVRVGPVIRLVHRHAWTQLIGPIPDGLTLDHLCRNKACVNPDHLEPVTSAVNTWRGGTATRTHCIRGHEFTFANTYRYGNRRACRTCAHLRYKAKVTP